MNTITTIAQVSLNRPSPVYWRLTLDNLPLDFMNPEFVLRMRGLVAALDEVSGIPQGPGSPEARDALLVRDARTPAVSLTLIRSSGGAPEPQVPRLAGTERAPEGPSIAPRIASFDKSAATKTKRLATQAKRALPSR